MKKSTKSDEGFTTKFFKKNSGDAVMKHGMTGLIALLVSSVVPLLQQWHADKQEKDALNAVESRCLKQIDDFKKDQSEKDKAQWEVIQKMMSKKYE